MPTIEQIASDAELAFVNTRGTRDIIAGLVAAKKRSPEDLAKWDRQTSEARGVARALALLVKNKHRVDPDLLAVIEAER